MVRKKRPAYTVPALNNPLLEALKPAHRLAVTLTARGVPHAEVAKVLNLNYRTLTRWHQKSWFQPALQALLDDLTASILSTFAPMLPAAIQAYENNLKKAHPGVAQDVMDRLFGKPVQRIEAKSLQAFHISFSPLVPKSPDVTSPDVIDAGPAVALESPPERSVALVALDRHSVSALPDFPGEGPDSPREGKG